MLGAIIGIIAPIIGIIVFLVLGKEILYRLLFEFKNWKKEYEKESQKGYWDYINEMKDKAKKDQK